MAKRVLKMAIRCLVFDRRFLGGKAGGYIMAIVRQHRLLADLGPEYIARLGGIIAAVDNPCIAEPKECL